MESLAEQPTCRICFTGADDSTDGQQLVSPCKCQGSSKYIHLACLRQWQRTVQLQTPNHPEEASREDRHLVCNVCRAAFTVAPQDRASMMSDLAGTRPEEVEAGMLLITKRSSEEAALGSGANIAVRAFIEAKAAHFRRAVYVLTEIIPGASDGSDAVIGLNLCRALEAPNIKALAGSPSEDVLAEYADAGVNVVWMNGGPVKPRVVCAIGILENLSPSRCSEMCTQDGLHQLIPGPPFVCVGSLRLVLEAAAEDLKAASDSSLGTKKSATVLAWAGFAQWSRTQLLGEMARGSWGWCKGTAADISAAIRSQQDHDAEHLWDSLRHAPRLSWAPENELSRDFENRFSRITRPAPAAEAEEGDQQALIALVQQFELLRRGGEEATLPEHGDRRIPRGRACSQQ
eukprot:TRINITY_DN76882_c0_g1_i1.p1 TRINITY_DN76882_c0_g1~~TRINITY_DN76882_c0_g1_i1.p1  ORF type:complete len:430 (+),score=77.17 TRINITY_DN76882_c0_g1_i1:85-1290(+)